LYPFHREGEALNDRHDSPVGRRVFGHPEPLELRPLQYSKKSITR
jgi:hypothetical protein